MQRPNVRLGNYTALRNIELPDFRSTECSREPHEAGAAHEEVDLLDPFSLFRRSLFGITDSTATHIICGVNAFPSLPIWELGVFDGVDGKTQMSVYGHQDIRDRDEVTGRVGWRSNLDVEFEQRMGDDDRFHRRRGGVFRECVYRVLSVTVGGRMNEVVVECGFRVRGVSKQKVNLHRFWNDRLWVKVHVRRVWRTRIDGVEVIIILLGRRCEKTWG